MYLKLIECAYTSDRLYDNVYRTEYCLKPNPLSSTDHLFQVCHDTFNCCRQPSYYALINVGSIDSIISTHFRALPSSLVLFE